MDYEINAPISFVNSGEVRTSYANSLSSELWNVGTSVGSLVAGSTTTPNVIQLDPNGETATNVLRLRRGSNWVKLHPDLALSTNYSYNFPANPPSGDAQMITSSGATNVFYDIHAQNTIYVRKNPGPGEFSSIAAAVAAVVAPSASNTWLIWVFPGNYSEPSFTIPVFTYVCGVSMQNVIITPSSLGAPLVTFSNNTGFAFASIKNTDPAFPAFYFRDVGDYALIFKIEFEDCVKCIKIETTAASTEDSQVYMEYTGTTRSYDYAVYAVDSGSSFENFSSIENFFTYEHQDFGIHVDGSNVELISQSTVMQSDGTGIAFQIDNGARLDLRGTYIENWLRGIWVTLTPGTPVLYAEGVLFEGCSHKNILIENVSTQGFNDGYTAYPLTQVPYSSPFFIVGQDPRIITVAKKGANFTTITAALAIITDNSITNRYTIYVGPGVYDEPNIVMKPFVSIVGFYKTSTIIRATSATGPLITGAPYAALSNLMLKGDLVPGLTTLAIQYYGDATGMHFRVEDVVFDSFFQLVDVSSDNGPCIFLLLSPLINVESKFTKGFTYRDSPVTHNPVFFYINDLFWNPNTIGLTNFSSLIEVSSTLPVPGVQNVFGAIQSTVAGHQPVFPNQGSAFTMTGACNVLITSTAFGGYVDCISVLPSAGYSVLQVTSVSCIGTNTNCVDIQNPNAQGALNGIIDFSKVNIISGADFGVTLTDPNGNIALGGQIYQGEDWGLVTNITEQIQHASTTGQVDGPLILSVSAGLNINVAGGRGYVFLGPISANYLKYVLWSAIVVPVPDNQLSWIFVDGTGTVQVAASIPSYIQNIILGTVKTFSGAVTYIQDIGTNINNLSSQIDDTLRSVFGPIVKSGMIGSPGSSLVARNIQISLGQYNLSTIEYFPQPTDPISMIGYYNSGNSQTAAFTDVPLSYDNAGTLTAIPSGSWAKHAVYVLTSLATTSQFFLVYAQQTYATEALAVNGNLPAQPPFFLGNMCPFTAVVVSGDDTNTQLSISRFLDIRPTLSFTASSSTATLDHNSLLNLTVGNAHPQYLRVDGTEPMLGNLDMGTQNIIGSGSPNLIFGMNILSHASRHIPSGADPLPTAAPSTISTSNQIGSADSFSRSDHIHAHGSQTDPTMHALATTSTAGFMSGPDKLKLDSATSTPTATTLTEWDSGKELSALGYKIWNTAQTAYAEIVANPAAFGGPNHIINLPIPLANETFVLQDLGQTLTNKTMTSATNTLYSKAFFVNTNVPIVTTGAPVPSVNQVLYADSTSTASWLTINNAFLQTQGVTFAVTAGSGLTGGGSATVGNSVSLAVNGASSFVGNRVVLSTSTPGFVEAGAMAAGQLLIGTGAVPVVGSLTSPTSSITITPGSGTLFVDLPNLSVSGTYNYPSVVVVDTYGRITSITSGGGIGVTSVGLSMPSIFGVANSPITNSGTINVTFNTQTAATFLAGPATGPDAIPTFRQIQSSDIPQIDLTSKVTGVLPVANGGTGVSAITANRIVFSDVTGLTTFPLGDGQVFVGNSTGSGVPTAATITGTAPITVTSSAGAISIGLTTPLAINFGGLGISTTPTLGQIPIGTSLGSYSLGTIVGTANQVAVNLSGNYTLSTPNVFIAPGTIQDTSGMRYSTSTLAANGTSIATTAVITTSYVVVNTASVGNTAIRLPDVSLLGVGIIVNVVNRSAQALNIFPFGGTVSIGTSGAGASVPLAIGASVEFQALTTTQWNAVAPYTSVSGAALSVAYGSSATTISLGTVPVANGGTGLTTAPATGQILIGNGGTSYGFGSVTAGNGISVSSTVSAITISLATPFTGANRIVLTNGANNALTAVALTNGQLLIGSTGLAPTAASLTAGTNITITPGAGSITVGVTNNSLTVSAGTGLTGGGSVALGGTTTLSLSVPVTIANGGTGTTSSPSTTGQILISSGAGAYSLGTINGTANQITSTYSSPNYVLSIPNQLTFPGYISYSAGSYNGSGTTQVGATLLATTFCALNAQAGGDAFILPVPVPGTTIVISNRLGLLTAQIFPNVGARIDGLAINASAPIALSSTATYTALSSTQWYTTVKSLVANTSSGITVSYLGGVDSLTLTTVPPANGGTGNNALPALGQILAGNGSNTFTLGVIQAVAGQTTVAFTAPNYNIGLPNVGTSGTYASPSSITVDAFGRVSSITAGVAAGGFTSVIYAPTISVGVTAGQQVGSFVWNNANYSGFVTRRIEAWVTPGSTAGRNLTIQILDGLTLASLGSVTIAGGGVAALQSFTFTAPGANMPLIINLIRVGAAGGNPVIRGINIILN